MSITIDRSTSFVNSPRQLLARWTYGDSQRGPRASTGVDPKEIEANQFAAMLLMPERLVRSALREMRVGHPLDHHVEQLARQFDVSVQAMTIRLATLGVL